MENLNDIKNIILGSPINIFNSILFLIFIGILYFVGRNLNKQNKSLKREENVEKKENTENFLNIYNNQLDKLEKEISISYENFYKKLIFILKGILELRGAKNISKMTFEEIQKLKLKKNLVDLISNIYFKEYSNNVVDNLEIRKNLITEVRKLLNEI